MSEQGKRVTTDPGMVPGDEYVRGSRVVSPSVGPAIEANPDTLKINPMGQHTPDHSLLDTPGEVSGDPYPMPDLAEVNRIEEETVQQVATIRDEQSLRIANLATDGAPHFLVNIEGQELCGRCHQPFPCKSWRADIEPRNVAKSAGAESELDTAKVHALMELLPGTSEEAARRMVREASAL